MFHAEYSSGQPLRMLVDLRASIAAALELGASTATRGATNAVKAAAAVAGLGSSGSVEQAKAAESSAAPEFEVSSHSEWDASESDESSKT
jgi:hypothetical protein